MIKNINEAVESFKIKFDDPTTDLMDIEIPSYGWEVADVYRTINYDPMRFYGNVQGKYGIDRLVLHLRMTYENEYAVTIYKKNIHANDKYVYYQAFDTIEEATNFVAKYLKEHPAI